MLFAPPPIETALDEENGVPEWPEHDRLTREKESLGFYLSGHPFEKRGGFLKRIAGNTTATVGQLQPSESVRIAGMISGVRILQIKQGKNAGKKMAKFLLEDLEAEHVEQPDEARRSAAIRAPAPAALSGPGASWRGASAANWTRVSSAHSSHNCLL